MNPSSCALLATMLCVIMLCSCKRAQTAQPAQASKVDSSISTNIAGPATMHSTAATSSSVATTQPSAEEKPKSVQPFEGVTVFPSAHEVHIESVSCLEEGFLEQIACSPHTREHESLVVTKIRPSHVHAALLMAGLEPGAPGRWVYEGDSYSVVPPRGDAVEVFVRYVSSDGKEIEERIQTWMREVHGEEFRPFPPGAWVFGGSRFENNPEFMGPGEHYVADMTGSIVGLVTFGDEVVGFSRVMPDLVEVSEPVWEVDTDHVPKMDTPVTLILRKATDAP